MKEKRLGHNSSNWGGDLNDIGPLKLVQQHLILERYINQFNVVQAQEINWGILFCSHSLSGQIVAFYSWLSFSSAWGSVVLHRVEVDKRELSKDI